ncbi:PepSY domain-containing protein [Lentibacillus daqui]|uniref:PepSY domain-containing protein n=1 Tax=Lentibacillus daqui TaxID=2911514 RepID=UPI0022B19F16|nr:PepSY domain-containing protein [Lentibacillus daqui]
MGMKKAVLATGLGVAVGYLARQQMEQIQKITPEKALKQAKEAFKRQGPISGSWIYMKPESVEKNGLTYQAYRGGITRNIDGENKPYEFHVDLETGAVIDAVPTT